MSYKLAFFDLDGTLIDSLPDIAQSINTIFEQEQLSPVSLSNIRNFIGNGSRELIRKCLQSVTSDITDDRLELVLTRFIDYYSSHSFIYSIFYDDVLNILPLLSTTNILITNKAGKTTDQIITQTPLQNYFQKIITPETYQIRKPSPEGVLFTLKEYGVSQKDAVLIGDSINDLICAQESGIHSIMVTYGYGDYDEIKRADTIINHFKELLPILNNKE